uniref:SCP domain-containing protein n=1 Tax=Strongyloides venezuelensis TaxID=75913 RepID=A0A0K0FIY8_STRVS
MRIYIIVYVSITFIISLIKTQELAVTYLTMYFSQHRKIYSYHEQMYSTLKQMVDEILRDHEQIDPRNLLITKISSLSNIQTYFPEKRKYKNISTGKYETRILPYLITEYYIKNSLKYVCNGKTFDSYFNALNYVKAKRNNHLLVTRKPSMTIPPSIDINSLTNQKIFCRNFWSVLWKFCNYQCYSSDNFKIMKQKFLQELNYYRAKYGAKPLIENSFLSSSALNLLIQVIPLRKKIDITKFENVGKGTLITAPLILNKWFGERKFYTNNDSHSPITKHFIAMVCKSASMVGIAIKRVDNEIYVKILYDKKVDMANEYKKNIIKKVNRRPSYVG